MIDRRCPPCVGGVFGKLRAMKTTMDRAEPLVIPNEIRREAKLAPGAPLEVRWRGRIEIEPAADPEAVEHTRSKFLDDRSPGG